ncbi:hypothetical protein [Flavobacterium sp.]|uniref:hypothetical protein n=1 Tax=Flavobacterium sp. TaxID=239 RepID=UPI003D0FB566
MKKLLFSVFVFLTFLHTQHAQESNVESKKYRFVFQMDNRFSSLRGVDISILGGKLGFQYKKLFRLGLGTSFILWPVTISYVNKKTHTVTDNKVSFWYVSVFNDWILYKNKHWECFLTEQVGFGKPSFVREVNDAVVSDVNIPLYVNEVSGQVNYKITDWIGVGTGIGYRNIWNQKAALKATFDAPIYIGKIIIYPEGLFGNSK